MDNSLNTLKESYLVNKNSLLEKYKQTKNEVASEKKAFKIEQNRLLALDIQSASDPLKIKKLKRNSKLDIAAFEIEENKKNAAIKSEIKELKLKYKTDCNNVWKKENISKLSTQADANNEKLNSIKAKYDLKIQEVEKKYDLLIEDKKNKISVIRDEQARDEKKFIEEYTNADDFYDSEFLAGAQYRNDEKQKLNVRYLKKEIRKLSDAKEAKLKKIVSTKELKVSKFEFKTQSRLEFDKPFSKFWFTNQVLTWVNAAAKNIDQQRHMYAIKMGLVYLMPFTLIAAFWTLMNSVILSTNEGGFLYLIGVAETQGLTNFKAIGGIVSNSTLGLLGMGLAFGASATLGDRYKLGKIESGLIGLSSFMIFMPMVSGSLVIHQDGDKVFDSWGNFINFADLGTSSMFLAIVTSIASIELYRGLMNIEFIKIKMPKQVPTAVAKSFNALTPFLILTFIFSSMSFCLLYFAEKNLNEIISMIIAKPLSSGVESLGGAMLIRFLTDGFWAIGIHGENMVSTIVGPTYLAALNENMDLINQGLDPVNIVTSTFMDTYMLPMKTTAVIVALFFFSKRKDHLAIMGVAFIPALFNISEPVLFGLPIILNPLLAIPFVLGSQVLVIVAYLLTASGFTDPMSVLLPWTTPAFIGPFLGSAGDPMAIVTAAILFAIGVAIYAPFILISNQQFKMIDPEGLVQRFTFMNKFGSKKAETYAYLGELESENKVTIKQKNK